MMQVVPGSTRYYCRVEGCAEFTDNVPYGYCSAHLGRALDGEPLPTKRGFPDVGTHDVGQQGVFHGAAALVERATTGKSETTKEQCMNFGEAIQAMKDGKSVQRAGWNGKNMHIYLEDSFSFPLGDGVFKGQKRDYEPVICMFTAQGKHQPGWLASQPDILAEDWQVIDG